MIPLMPEDVLSDFHGEDAPSDQDMYRCVHCGLCLSACPTYMELGVETESPRGRIALMKAVNEGRAQISERIASHWDLCLGCRACEAMCPSGVPYGRLIENTRSQQLKKGRQTWNARIVQMVFLRGLLPRLRLLRLMVLAMRIYQRSKMQWMLRSFGLLKLAPAKLRQLEEQIPDLSGPVFRASGQKYPANGEIRHTVGLLSGCVMPLVQGSTMEASVRVLQHNGCAVVVPIGQGCCGALNLHSGDAKTARRMARHNIDIFLQSGVENIVVASAGCGSTMKEYTELLKNDPDYAYKAREFAERTLDITEFLVQLPIRAPTGKVEARVTYQDPCHLVHAQRISRAPREILNSIPGIQFVEMENASRCCGAAGTYSMTQKAMSERLLDRKMAWLLPVGADIVTTANPGCALQLELGLKRAGDTARVCHVVDLLDQAYSREKA